MNSTDTPLLTVPLGREAHATARQFTAEILQLVAEQDRHQVAKRVYLNTLAVYAVHSYLTWQAYETDITQGDRWHPVLRARWDVADLVITGIGKLECRPVWEEETVLTLPTEVTSDRIGCIAVQFGEQLNSGKLLGFAPAVDVFNAPLNLQVADLQPLDNFIEYLYRLEIANDFLTGDDLVAVRVRELLETRDIPEIVVQLERIYRTTKRTQWRYSGANTLAGSVIAEVTHRESSVEDESGKMALRQLAQSLMDRLATIWENAA